VFEQFARAEARGASVDNNLKSELAKFRAAADQASEDVGTVFDSVGSPPLMCPRTSSSI
jgi:hypothetical protein